MNISAKTVSILKRLPHFYNPGEAGESLRWIMDVFGKAFERTEEDIYKVLRAHHSITSENKGSQGFTAAEENRGDLDKLFALYLESVGGTSQIVKMNPQLTLRSINTERLFNALLDAPESSICNQLFELFSPEDKTELKSYAIDSLLFTKNQITSNFLMDLLLRRSSIAFYLAGLMSEKETALLNRFNGKDISDELAESMANFLNSTVLMDTFLFSKNLDQLVVLELSGAGENLKARLFPEKIKQYYLEKEDYKSLSRFEDRCANLEPIKPLVGSHLIRLNRLLLDTISRRFGHQWQFTQQQMQIPDELTVCQRLVGALNALLAKEEDKHVTAFFNTSNLTKEIPAIDGINTAYKETLWYRRMVLENLFPFEIESVYRSYEKRQKAIIKVLRHGASTRQGIIEVVAANLGIIGDTPEVMKVRQLIEIEEFDPDITRFFEGNVAFIQAIPVKNSNPMEETPKIRLTMLNTDIKSVRSIKIKDRTLKREVCFPVNMTAGDLLEFDGDIIRLNGVQLETAFKGNRLSIEKYKTNIWHIEAEILPNDAMEYQKIGHTEQLDNAAFSLDESLWDKSVFIGADPIFKLEVLAFERKPGQFTIQIPWHIPGFTDKFAETTDHPRHQILKLVQKVKAAGVKTTVAYRQSFAEDHLLNDAHGVSIEGPLLSETQIQTDALIWRSDQAAAEDQNMRDQLHVSGVFDFTEFDGLNKFA